MLRAQHIAAGPACHLPIFNRFRRFPVSGFRFSILAALFRLVTFDVQFQFLFLMLR